MKVLVIKAFASLFILLAVIAGMLFLTAGTLDYREAWVFLAVYGVSGMVITGYMARRDPKLLERRMRGGPAAEKEISQKIIMAVSSAGFISIFVVSALDHRLEWSRMPFCMSVAGDVIISLGYAVVFLVFRVNSFTSATIELAADQTVISAGPYAVVRHPMYGGSIIMLIGMPIALGSWWGLLVIGVMLPALIWRIVEEERFLKRNLPGYVEYCNKVRFRLIPIIW